MIYTRGATLSPALPTTMALVDSDVYPLALSAYDNGSPFIVKNYDFGSPTPREVLSDKAGRPGVDDLTSLFGGRTITLQLNIMDAQEASRHQLLDVLRAMLNPTHRPWLYAQCQGWGQERRISLRGNPLSCVVGQNHSSFLEVSLVFSAPAGVWEAVDYSILDLVYPLSGVTTFSIPAGNLLSPAFLLASGGDHSTGVDPTAPALVLSSGSGNNTVALSDLGSAPSYPILIINGTSIGPVIHNITDNTSISFSNYTVPQGHFILIDMGAKTALLDGDSNQSVYNHIDWSVSSWFSLTQGAVIQFTTKSNDNNSSLAISYSPSYF